jgi:hypothetical protein
MSIKYIWRAQLGLTPHSYTPPWVTEFPIRPVFSYNYFVTGEEDKAFFSIPGNTVMQYQYLLIFLSLLSLIPLLKHLC